MGQALFLLLVLAPAARTTDQRRWENVGRSRLKSRHSTSEERNLQDSIKTWRNQETRNEARVWKCFARTAQGATKFAFKSRFARLRGIVSIETDATTVPRVSTRLLFSIGKYKRAVAKARRGSDGDKNLVRGMVERVEGNSVASRTGLKSRRKLFTVRTYYSDAV